MTRPMAKTIYLHGKNETTKDGQAREKKIRQVAKKINDTESAAVRLMIDAYTL